jgi:hypothetical protein
MRILYFRPIDPGAVPMDALRLRRKGRTKACLAAIHHINRLPWT